MSDIDAAGMSHIGPKKDIVRERVARAWHAGSEHAAESPFGGPLCNCWQVAGRIMPMLREAWREGRKAGVDDMIAADLGVNRRNLPNPYETKEDR